MQYRYSEFMQTAGEGGVTRISYMNPAKKSQSWRSPHLELSLHIPSNLDAWNTTCLLGKPILRGYVRFIEVFFEGWRDK